ncbi:MAG TPA: DUF1800 domain-containing protein [Pyrinomonadaceae bacterium]|jgi:hypothetical protein|nr:DUF1800 domain-containing protein [Pyrinomonadaceae bacterium]
MPPSRPNAKRFIRSLSACLLLVLCAGTTAAQNADTSAPVLLTEADSIRAVALESVNFLRDPFTHNTHVAFNADRRTRVALFAMNIQLYAGEGANAFTAEAEDGARRVYPLEVEHVGPVPEFGGITQIVVRLHDQMADAGDVLVRVSLRGMSSNRVRLSVGHAGGGLPDDTGAVPTPAPPTSPAPRPQASPNSYTGPASAPDAVRFLEQATFGPTQAQVARVQSIGIRAYLEEQFNAPASGYPTLPLMPLDANLGCQGGDARVCYRDNYTMYPLQIRLFKNAFYKPDQLRQRVAFALHQIFVVSGRELNETSWMSPYLQTLDRHAFGNFRQLLYDITRNPAMGDFLSTAGNTKEKPNENFAREILQLFTVGPDLLHPDGTPKLDAGGNRIPVYNQATITNFARVFTGWGLAVPPPDTQGILNFADPMIAHERHHDTDAKTLLGGATLPPNQTTLQDLNAALDNIFNHPNVGPFIGKRLIRQLVTSNPSAAYVGRVASVFDNNCAGFYADAACPGERGDLRAVVRAILLDPEARGDIKTDPNYGRLREPVQFIAAMCRAFDARGIGAGGVIVESDGHLEPYATEMGQDVLRPPTVFGYFPAEHIVPGTTLKGPEFGILSSSTALRRIGFTAMMVYGNGIFRGKTIDTPEGTFIWFSSFMPLASDPARVVSALDTLLLHGSMSPNMRDAVTSAVAVIPPTEPNYLLRRTQMAVYLILTSPQYQVQR